MPERRTTNSSFLTPSKLYGSSSSRFAARSALNAFMCITESFTKAELCVVLSPLFSPLSLPTEFEESEPNVVSN